jgi:hypothetical protein
MIKTDNTEFIVVENTIILETSYQKSGGEDVLFGLKRNRNPDNDWGQLSWVNLESNPERVKRFVSIEDLPTIQTLIEDLAYAYGYEQPLIFTQKLNEFGIITLFEEPSIKEKSIQLVS